MSSFSSSNPKPKIHRLKKKIDSSNPSPPTQRTTPPSDESDLKIPELSPAELDDLITKRFRYTIEYIITSLVFLFFFFSGGLASMGLSTLPFLWTAHRANQISNLGRKLSLAYRENAEYRISTLLLEKFFRPGTTLYSIFDDTKPDVETYQTVEIILHLSSELIFAISVRNIISLKSEPIRVFYDPAVDTLRFRKASRGKKNFRSDLLLDSHQRVQWLLENRPDVLPHPPIEILVFSEPVQLIHHPDTPMKVLAPKRRFMYHKGVYVVEESKLVTLIKMLSPKPTS